MSDPLPTPASVRRRLGARLVDVITLLWCLGFVLVELDQRLLGGDPLGQERLRVDLSQTRSLLFVIITIGAYEIVPTTLKGATLGKAVFGLRTHPIEPGKRLPWIRSLARALVLYGAPVALGAYGGFVVLVLLVSIVVPASGRGIHDRVAGSVVWVIPREDDDR